MAGFDFSGAISALKTAHNICVCGHINPDGDCLGSVMGLTLGLRRLGLNVTPLLASAEKPRMFDFLEGFDELVPAREFKTNPDVFVVVDVPDLKRLGDGAAVLNRAGKVIRIDHHPAPEAISEITFEDTTAAAAGMLIWELLGQADVDRSGSIASWCYTALVTDTGRFQFQNADARALNAAAEMVTAGASPNEICTNVYQRKSLAALKFEALVAQRLLFACDGRVALSYITQQDYVDLDATTDDSDSLIDYIRQLDGIEVAIMLREQEDFVRGSIRSKGSKDVAAIAREMNGGGHRAAAGFTLYEDLEKAKQTVLRLVERSYEPKDGE